MPRQVLVEWELSCRTISDSKETADRFHHYFSSVITVFTEEDLSLMPANFLGKITQNKGHFAIFAVQFHSRSPIFVPIEYIRLLIKTIARPVLRIKSWIYQSARNLYRGRRAVALQTFTTRHSNRKWSIVMALSTTFTQHAPKITKFLKNHAK